MNGPFGGGGFRSGRGWVGTGVVGGVGQGPSWDEGGVRMRRGLGSGRGGRGVNQAFNH